MKHFIKCSPWEELTPSSMTFRAGRQQSILSISGISILTQVPSFSEMEHHSFFKIQSVCKNINEAISKAINSMKFDGTLANIITESIPE
jgi:hypothetical protein